MEQFSRVRISGEVRSKTFGLTYLRKFWKIQFYSDKKRHDPMHRRRHFVYWKSYPFWSETFRIMVNCYNIDCFIGWLPNFQWCAETKYSSFWYGLDVSLLLISKWNISNRKKMTCDFKNFEIIPIATFWTFALIFIVTSRIHLLITDDIITNIAKINVSNRIHFFENWICWNKLL